MSDTPTPNKLSQLVSRWETMSDEESVYSEQASHHLSRCAGELEEIAKEYDNELTAARSQIIALTKAHDVVVLAFRKVDEQLTAAREEITLLKKTP